MRFASSFSINRKYFAKKICENFRLYSTISNGRKRFSVAFEEKWSPFTPSSSKRYLSSIDDLNLENVINNDAEYRKFSRDIFTHDLLAGIGHSVAIIQPSFLEGPRTKTEEELDIMMDEAIALVESLPRWKVAEKMNVPIRRNNFSKGYLFGPGQMEYLTARVRGKPTTTAVFINWSMLNGLQHADLRSFFGLPIFDRFTLVLEIFRTYAKTKEAKLQIAIAELEYLKVRLGRTRHWDIEARAEDGRTLSVSGEVFTDAHKMLLQQREDELRRHVETVRTHRTMIRTSKKRENWPVVSIIGYTNAGKTSLIRCLTQDQRLVPEDRLFATLNVTVHAGVLQPLGLNVLYADTVGFVSNIPTQLVSSFTQMLDDIRFSKQLVHVRDMSHPDRAAQKQSVLETLRKLEVPKELMDTMIEVWNKVDRIPNIEDVGETPDENVVFTSCHTGQGLKDVQLAIQRNVVVKNELCVARFLIPNGGEAYRFLDEETSIQQALPTEAGDELIVTTLLKRHVAKQFIKKFGNLLYKPPAGKLSTVNKSGMIA